MKLLSKKDITSAQAKTQKQTYDEGMKLARRVDGLREVAAAEESSLERFRRETIATIHEEITKETAKRDTLRQEVSRLQKDREEALKPLDELGEKLAEEEYRLKDEREALGRTAEALNTREESLDRREHSISDEELRIADQKRLHNELLSTAHNERTSARLALEEAQRELSNIRLEKERISSESLKLDAHIKATEERQAKRDKEQDEREVILNGRETRVLDRAATYERQLKRKI